MRFELFEGMPVIWCCRRNHLMNSSRWRAAWGTGNRVDKRLQRYLRRKFGKGWQICTNTSCGRLEIIGKSYPLPLGEGRVRVSGLRPSPAAARRPLPEGEGIIYRL